MKLYEFRAMNSAIQLAAEGETRDVELAFELGRATVELYAERWTRFEETSELARLNRSAGSWCKVSVELFDLLREANGFVSQTRGLFEPAILDALEAAGYDKSMEEIKQRQGAGRPARARQAGPRHSLGQAEFDMDSRSVRLPPGARIDLGGIAKGWIAEQAALAMSELANACAANAGGDVYMIGLPAGEKRWSIEVEDPMQPERTAAVLYVPPGAVATSSVAKRRWNQGGVERHHLIDPRTGEPADSDWVSVTVVASRLTTAEVWAKALLIAGPREAEGLMQDHDGLTFVAVDREGKLWGWRGIGEFLNDGFQAQVPGRDVGRAVNSSISDSGGVSRDPARP